jgi:hypothetical protein
MALAVRGADWAVSSPPPPQAASKAIKAKGKPWMGSLRKRRRLSWWRRGERFIPFPFVWLAMAAIRVWKRFHRRWLKVRFRCESGPRPDAPDNGRSELISYKKFRLSNVAEDILC